MDKENLMKLLQAVRQGEVSPEEAAGKLQMQPFEDLQYAKVDHHRGIRLLRTARHVLASRLGGGPRCYPFQSTRT